MMTARAMHWVVDSDETADRIRGPSESRPDGSGSHTSGVRQFGEAEKLPSVGNIRDTPSVVRVSLTEAVDPRTLLLA